MDTLLHSQESLRWSRRNLYHRIHKLLCVVNYSFRIHIICIDLVAISITITIGFCISWIQITNSNKLDSIYYFLRLRFFVCFSRDDDGGWRTLKKKGGVGGSKIIEPWRNEQRATMSNKNDVKKERHKIFNSLLGLYHDNKNKIGRSRRSNKVTNMNIYWGRA